MADEGVDLSAGPDLSINPRRIVEEPIDLTPRNPAIGAGPMGSNIAAPMSPTAAAAQNPLDAAEEQLTATRNKAMVGATNPVFNFLFEDQAKAKQQEVIDANLKIEQIRQAKQTQQTNQALAKNMGLTRSMSPTAGPGDITEEALREWRENGNFDAYRGLHGAGQGARADLYMDEGVNALGKQAEKASSIVDQLNSAPTQTAYDSVRKMVLKDSSLSSLGMTENNVPKFKSEWDAQRGTVTAKLNSAKQVVEQFNQKQAQLSQAVPIADEKAAKAVTGQISFSNGEEIPNLKAVALPGAGGAQGGLAQPGSKDIGNYGKTWSNSTPEQVKTVREQLAAEEIKGAIAKYKISKDFYLTANNPKMFESATGEALLSDKLGAIGRDLAEGSKAAGSIGLTKMLDAKYGSVDSFLNSATKNYAAYRAWVDGGMKGEVPKLQPRMTPASIQGFKDIAAFELQTNKNELGRIGQPIETAGRAGIDLNKTGLDKESQATVKDVYDEATQKAKLDMDKYPAIIKGDRRIFLPQGARVPGRIPAGSYAAGLPKAIPPANGASGTPAVPPETSAATVPSTIGGGSNPNRGVSPDYLIKTAKVESGGRWDATASTTSASGAFQFTNATWNENKPAGAPARAADATPQQQTEAANNLTNKNTAALAKAGIPVNDTTAYVAHNLGSAGAVKFISAPVNAKARDVVGKEAADNNPLFFKGNPTVGEVKARYQAVMNADKQPTPEQVAAYNANKESFAAQRAKMAANATQNAANIAPALGAVAGSVVSPVAGTLAGGAAGGAVKNYFTGTPEQQTIPGYVGAAGKGVVEALPMAIPGAGPAAMAARVAAGGLGQAGIAAAEGADAGDIINAGVGGAAGATLGEGAGVFGHAMWSKFSPVAKAEMLDAAKVVATQEPKIAGAAGKMVDNPEYKKAVQSLKSIGKDPEQAAHDYRAVEAGMPKGEALAQRPAEVERAKVGKEYEAIKSDVTAAGVGAPKASPALTDGPMSTIRTPANPSGTVPERYAGVAQHAEIAVTAPAKSWGQKWEQLGQARSELLKGERDALASTATNKGEAAQAMRDMADSIRTQQEKLARHVMGPKADAIIQRLEAADVRYARAMTASGDGDIVKAIAQGGQKGREAQAAFDALAANDPAAKRMVRSLVEMEKSLGKRLGVGAAVLAGAATLHYIPVVGTAAAATVSTVKAGQMLRDYMAKRGAGAVVKFSDLVDREAKASFARRAGATIGSSVGGQLAR